MRVQGINKSNQSFTAMSERNNYYEATNAGKFIGLGLTVGGVAERIISKGGFKAFQEDYKSEVATALKEEFTNAGGKDLTIDAPTTALFKRTVRMHLIGSIALLAGCCLGAGIIFDEIVNGQRSNRADGHFF